MNKTKKPENPKAEKTEAKTAKSTNRPKSKEMVGDVLEFEIPKGLNPYGFIHVPKKAREFLPFVQGETLKAKVDTENQTLIIRKA